MLAKNVLMLLLENINIAFGTKMPQSNTALVKH